MQNEVIFLETLLLRLRSGESFRSSLRETPLHNILKTPELRSLARNLFQKIDAGEVSAHASVLGFKNYIETLFEMEQEFKARMRTPQVQVILSLFLGVVSVLASQILMPSELKPSLALCAGVLGVLTLGFICSQMLIQHSRARLWTQEWLFFLEKLSLLILSGHTLRGALLESGRHPQAYQKLPNPVRHQLLEFLAHSQDPSTPVLATLNSRHHHQADPQITLFRMHLKILGEALDRGLPIAQSLQEIKSSLKNIIPFEIKKTAEQLGFYLFIPLFVFSFPALGALWLWPLLSEISRILGSM